jgi:hypothetical protein
VAQGITEVLLLTELLQKSFDAGFL